MKNITDIKYDFYKRLLAETDIENIEDLQNILYTSALQNDLPNFQKDLDKKEDISNKGIANGYAGLDDSAKIITENIPDFVINVERYGRKDDFPMVGNNYAIYIDESTKIAYFFNGLGYSEVSKAPVDSVNGKIGSVVLDKADIGLANVDNTSDISKPISSAMQDALDLKRDISDSYSALQIDNFLSNKIDISERGVAGGVATLDDSGKVDAIQLPSFVDDVLEYNALSDFPESGERGKIYVALDTNKTYRWGGSSYIYITSGAVDSVNSKTGVVVLNKVDIGLENVDNTSDIDKPISSAMQNALNLKRNISNSYSKGDVDNLLNEKVDKSSGNQAGGYAKLDANANINPANIPNIFNNVEIYNNKNSFPEEGNSKALYIDTTSSYIYYYDPGSNSYKKLSNDLVTSVQNRTGDVVITKGDLSLAPTNDVRFQNIKPNETNKYELGSSALRYSVSYINIMKTNLIQSYNGNNGYVTLKSHFSIYNTKPTIKFTQSDANTDEKKWDLIIEGNRSVRQITSDDGTTVNRYETITRNGASVYEIKFSSQNIFLNGYTRLGNNSPKIKMKKISGTVGDANSTTGIAHGLNGNKILSFTSIVRYADRRGVQEEFTAVAGYWYSAFLDNANITIKTSSSYYSNKIYNKPIDIVITYEE